MIVSEMDAKSLSTFSRKLLSNNIWCIIFWVNHYLMLNFSVTVSNTSNIVMISWPGCHGCDVGTKRKLSISGKEKKTLKILITKRPVILLQS